MDYEKSYTQRLALIDKLYSGDIAKKKKADLRKLIYSGTNEEKRIAFDIAWANHNG